MKMTRIIAMLALAMLVISLGCAGKEKATPSQEIETEEEIVIDLEETLEITEESITEIEDIGEGDDLEAIESGSGFEDIELY